VFCTIFEQLRLGLTLLRFRLFCLSCYIKISLTFHAILFLLKMFGIHFSQVCLWLLRGLLLWCPLNFTLFLLLSVCSEYIVWVFLQVFFLVVLFFLLS
jgi:hypothetical protein